MSGWESLLQSYGLLAIFVIMLVKGTGVPIPIPADVLMIAVAAGAASGQFILWHAFAFVLLAMVTGGFVQFFLVRGPARALVYRFGGFIGLHEARLEAAASTLRRRGPLAVSMAILLPGVRAGAVAACGIAGMPVSTFVPGLVLGSLLFLGLHFGIGYLGVASLARLSQAVPLAFLAAIGIALIIAAIGVWMVIKRRQRPKARGTAILAEALEEWEEAACPVCLVLGAVSHKVLKLESPR